MAKSKKTNSKIQQAQKKFYEYDSSSDEYSVKTPNIITENYKGIGSNKFDNKKVDINQSLHFFGSMVYHSQDDKYYSEKQRCIKQTNVKNTKLLFKSIFREDNSTETINCSFIKECKVSNVSDVILHQRLIDKSLKVELKNFANPSYSLISPQIFSTSFKFNDFPTHVENHKLAKSTNKKKEEEFYRKPHIPLLTGYDSDKETSEPVRKQWENIDFKTINDDLKYTLKTGSIEKNAAQKDQEHIKEIISLLFIAETSRNHATYLMAPMFLELLGAKEISLKDSRIDDNFPMAMKLAVPASRALNLEYFKFLKSTYDYMMGDAGKASILRNKENELFKKWLLLKSIKSKPDKWIQSIKKLIDDWYGIQLNINMDDKEESFKKKDSFGKRKFSEAFPEDYYSKNLFTFKDLEVITQKLLKLSKAPIIKTEKLSIFNSIQNILNIISRDSDDTLTKNKSLYEDIENKGGGNCAVYAVRDALRTIDHEIGKIENTQIQSLRHKICNVTKSFISLYSLSCELDRKIGESKTTFENRTKNYNWTTACKTITKYYKDIFGTNNFNIFKLIVSKYIVDSLNSTNISEETSKNLQELQDTLNNMNNWQDLIKDQDAVKQIFKLNNTLDINVQAILKDHNLNEDIDPDEYYEQAAKKGIWLSNSEISAYLLTLGFVFESGNPSKEDTYITYINSACQKLYFYNNGVDNNTNNGAGTHWMATTLKGSGEFGKEKSIDWINSYFGKYTLDGLNNILELRIKDLKLENIKVLQALFVDETHNNICTLLSEINNSKEKIVLVSLNLFNKHAVGLIFEKREKAQDHSIQVKYIDPENKPIPNQLKKILENCGLTLEQLTTEQQKYSNCGSEVIEDFMFYLTGERYSQEEAIVQHSKLVEDKLLGKNILETLSCSTLPINLEHLFFTDFEGLELVGVHI